MNLTRFGRYSIYFIIHYDLYGMSHTKINHKFNSEMKKLSWRMKWAGFLLNNFISSDIIYFCYYFNKQLNIFSLLISVKVRKFNLFNSSIFPFYWWVIFGVGAQRLTHQLLTRPDLIRNFWLPEKVETIFRENLQKLYFYLWPELQIQPKTLSG